ncbi:MAG: hypothetical protein ACLTKG_07630 [Collinsella intestinalis]
MALSSQPRRVCARPRRRRDDRRQAGRRRGTGLTAEKSLETFEAEMREAYEALNAECDLVVTLCDIYEAPRSA